jgi:hypothetical protein
MMSSVAWSAPRSVAPVGSHPLPTMPVSGQQLDATLLSCTVAAYPHTLETRELSCVPGEAKHFLFL